MKHEKEPNSWDVVPGLMLADWIIILALCVLILLLSGCGTMASPSAFQTPTAPPAVKDPVPEPIYLNPKTSSKTSPRTASSATN